MSRKARLDNAGTLHHVMVRGVKKSSIFGDDQDRWKFLERLSIMLMDLEWYVYASALGVTTSAIQRALSKLSDYT